MKVNVTGDGALPLRSIIEALQDSGYDGYYSLEREPKWRPELRELNLDVNEVLASRNTKQKAPPHSMYWR
ncbi:hypothetical protein ACX1C1_15065 [Paenibacillus sp. strain BS8-2]